MDFSAPLAYLAGLSTERQLLSERLVCSNLRNVSAFHEDAGHLGYTGIVCDDVRHIANHVRIGRDVRRINRDRVIVVVANQLGERKDEVEIHRRVGCEEFRRRLNQTSQIGCRSFEAFVNDGIDDFALVALARVVAINVVTRAGERERRRAIEVLSHVFRGRKVQGIDCRALIEQHGSLHCATMQLHN